MSHNGMVSIKFNSYSASQETFGILWNQKDHYRIHTITWIVSILNQIYPVNTITTYYLKIRCNNILPFIHRSRKYSF